MPIQSAQQGALSARWPCGWAGVAGWRGLLRRVAAGRCGLCTDPPDGGAGMAVGIGG